MLQAFVICWREGFEAFLIVAITLAYLKKTGRAGLAPAVYSAIVASVGASVALGFVLRRGVNHALWEGILGLVAVAMVATLVVHMWRTAPRMKAAMEGKLGAAAERASRPAALAAIFLFTLLMITREGMETALLLLQVRDEGFRGGILLGLGAAALMAWAWVRYGRLINLKRFFQVTGLFLLLFMAQVLIYSLHELSEAGLFPRAEVFHEATEPFSPYGIYGKWFSFAIVLVCGGWLLGAWALDRARGANGRALAGGVS